MHILLGYWVLLNVSTHIIMGRMEFPTVINWSSPFSLKMLLGGILHFYSIFNRTFCTQTVETLIGRRVLWCLICRVCAVCLTCMSHERTLGLYGLMSADFFHVTFQECDPSTKQIGSRSDPTSCRA